MSIDSDVIRGHVDTIILKTLTTGDKYGYEIIKEIEQKSQGTYELKQPTLYSCLKRLENQGLISGYSKNSDIGGKRHYYKLTKKGRENYENSMQQWFNSRNIIDNLMGSKPSSISNEETLTELNNAVDIEHDENPETQEVFQEDEKQSSEDKEEQVEDEINFEPEEEKQVAQMVIDESSSITQENEPRNFENVNLDEEDVALLGDYYKTDENQIDLFDGNEFNFNADSDNADEDNHEEYDEEYDEDENDDDDHEDFSDYVDHDDNDEDNNTDSDDTESQPSSTPQFKNFSGADLSKYKNSSASNYFDSISVNDTDLTPIIDDSREEDEEDENAEDEEPTTQNQSSFGGFTSFNYFGNYSQFNDDEETNEDQNEDDLEYQEHNDDSELEESDESEEKREFIFPSYRIEEDNNGDHAEEKLHFGFGDYEEDNDDDNITIPSTFNDVDDLENNDMEQEIHPSISIFGEEDDQDIEENYDEPNDNDQLNEPIYSEPEYDIPTRTYISEQTTDLKPVNFGTYSEPEHKEKLNQLSAYTKANYETKPTDLIDETSIIEAKTITELKEDFDELGIEVRSYKKPEKEPLKDRKYLLVNKIKFATSWIVFGVMSLLLLGTYFLANNWGYNNLTLVSNALPAYLYYILAGVVALAIPVTYTVMYLLNRTKKVKPNYNAVISLVFALLFFVVCLNIVYTFNILNGFTKFTQTDYNHLLWLLPSIVSLVIVLQSIVYTILFKTKRFNA